MEPLPPPSLPHPNLHYTFGRNYFHFTYITHNEQQLLGPPIKYNLLWGRLRPTPMFATVTVTYSFMSHDNLSQLITLSFLYNMCPPRITALLFHLFFAFDVAIKAFWGTNALTSNNLCLWSCHVTSDTTHKKRFVPAIKLAPQLQVNNAMHLDKHTPPQEWHICQHWRLALILD